MSTHFFIESTSADAVERALAAKAVVILNQAGLSRQERVQRIAQLQRELLRHRQNLQTRQQLLAYLQTLPVIDGATVRAVQISQGRVMLCLHTPKRSISWRDMGAAPAGWPLNSMRYDIKPHRKRQPRQPGHWPERKSALG